MEKLARKTNQIVSDKRNLRIHYYCSRLSLYDVDSLCFDGIGIIDNINVGIVEQDVNEVIVEGVAIPHSWLSIEAAPILAANGGDYGAAANATAANGLNKVWECYVAGLAPTNATAAFRIVISMENGAPVVGWEPKLSAAEEAKRTYTFYGRERLDAGGWTTPTNALHRFFKVGVEMK